MNSFFNSADGTFAFANILPEASIILVGVIALARAGGFSSERKGPAMEVTLQ